MMPPHGLTALADKNKLNAADAQAVESAFKAKLEALAVSDSGAPEMSLRAHPDKGKSKNRRRSRSIDKSVLTVPEPRRVRDRDHVKHVLSSPA